MFFIMVKAVAVGRWMTQSFMLPPGSLGDEMDRLFRVYTTADAKFSDTTLGGTYEINPLPQYTRYADIPRSPSSVSYASASLTGDKAFRLAQVEGGMGRAYSEIYHDHARRVHFRAGVPKFNTMLRFFGNFFDAKQATAARTGRLDKSFLQSLVGATVSLLTLPLQPLVFIGKVLRYWGGRPSTKYYYLKPTMETYWMAVGNIVNGIWAAMNVTNLSFVSQRSPILSEDEINAFSGVNEWGVLREVMPDVFGPNGYVDVQAICTRAERIRIQFQEKLKQHLDGKSGEDIERFFLMQLGNKNFSKRPMIVTRADGNRPETFEDYLNAYANTSWGSVTDIKETGMHEEPVGDDTIWDSSIKAEELSMGDHYAAMLRDAAEWITYRVEDIGSVSESFSNSTKESGIASTINSMSASARDKRFNVMDGNITGWIGSLYDGVKSLLTEAADSLSISGIAALGGSAFVDIPEQWDDSSASINDMSFTIQLRAPYNNPVSKLQNVIIPLAGLLGLALPLSTGQQSYTSPFLVEVISPGQGHIRLGIVESLSITRAVGDVKWASDMSYMGVDVTINIKDLSSVVHMPIGIVGGGIVKGAVTLAGLVNAKTAAAAIADVGAAFSEETYNVDNLYNDYLGTLASLSFEDLFHKTALWQINRKRTALQYMRNASDTWLAMVKSDSNFNQIIRTFAYRGGR